MNLPKKAVKNFCIIAHIDHGKSTLADRMIELTGTVSEREMKNQLLDSMDLERERGITIKLQPVRMLWKGMELNLIDTPGHIDFNYEVSRSLAAVEGAVLLVDATQGIEAQTLANLYLAIEQNLTIIPVINKIDLPAADVAKVKREIMHIVGSREEEILAISAKTGEGVTSLLDAVIERIPSAQEKISDPLKGLIFDAQYNEYKGVVIYVRIFSGTIKKGDTIDFVKAAISAEVLDVGFFTPALRSAETLAAGSIGYIVTNIKDIQETRVGDTISHVGANIDALQGYRDVKPMVFAGVYPSEGDAYEKLRSAVFKLKLNDSSLTFVPDHSEVLGFGFRCGFLGLLHLEIFQERLLREFSLSVVITAPTVAYTVYLNSGEQLILTSPSALPDESRIERIEQPVASVDLITPKKYLGPLMDYVQKRRGAFLGTEFIDEERVIVRCKVPLANIVVDFYDTVKNISSGYASYTYELSGFEKCSLARLDIVIADEPVPGLAILIPRDESQSIGRSVVTKLKEIIPRAQFTIKIQAAIGGKVVASERISPLRKDVTAKLYGGDVTRKRKLLEKQKKGKKRMQERGGVEIPHTAYLAILKRN